MKDQRKRLPLAEQIRKGLEEAIRHAKGEITLKTTTLEGPPVFPAGRVLRTSSSVRPDDSPQSGGEPKEDRVPIEEARSD
jgi:hypothetical protein